jgi:hypothetical protein
VANTRNFFFMFSFGGPSEISYERNNRIVCGAGASPAKLMRPETLQINHLDPLAAL